MLADVDGTLVDPDKKLTPRAVAAVARLHEAGIIFAVTSGRPPRGMAMLVEPLDLRAPISAFNGGLIVEPDLSVIEQKVLPEALVDPVIDLMGGWSLDVWLYRGSQWYVRDPDAPHVEREAWTVQFQPTVVTDFKTLGDSVAKLVGVGDDHEVVAQATQQAQDRFGDRISAAQSQPYYLDVTHPDANKGSVVGFLAERYEIAPEAIATIGDMPNDVLMFARSGLSIAMGNASDEVKRQARRVTGSYDSDGFADAVEQFVLA